MIPGRPYSGRSVNPLLYAEGELLIEKATKDRTLVAIVLCIKELTEDLYQ